MLFALNMQVERALSIENHEIHPLDREKFEANYDKQGITRLLLEIKSGNKCH
jgi:hypothetical protein